MDSSKPLKILILPTIGIGDVLMFTPALRCLRKSFPLARIDFFVMTESARDVLANNPNLDRLIYFPLLDDKINGVKFLIQLRREKYNVSINIFPSNKKEYNLVSWLIGAQVRLGHRYIVKDVQGMNFLNNRRVKQSGREHGVYENLKLIETIGTTCEESDVAEKGLDYFLTEADRRTALEIEKAHGLKMGLHPGSSNRKTNVNKRWPKEKFVEFIKRLSAEFPEMVFFLFGGSDERNLRNFIRERTGLGDRIYLVDGTIREIAPYIRAMDLFLGNDSALVHLAAALKVPTAVIYGPTNPDWTYPFGVPHKVIRLGLDCSPCYQYSPKSLYCPAGRDFACLKELPVDRVFGSVLEFMKELGLKR